MKLLILGGYGVFGSRLAELLADLSDLEILIAGRNLTKATSFCDGYQGEANVTPLQLDRVEIATRLPEIMPDILVDASGPFQDYGESCYSVIEACIAHKINYLDFADAADFVFGVSQFDNAAHSAGIFVLSGVSSFPVLTAAVLREIAKNTEIVSVTGGIAPSPYAGIGLNVMRAVVSYAGSPVKLIRHGKPATGIGLGESIRYTVAPPGQLPLRNIHYSLVEVPDLQVIPPEHPSIRDIWMGAGPVPEILHRVLNLLAKARARFGWKPLTRHAPLFYQILNMMKFGEHRGGMFIHVKGKRDGKPTAHSWHLLAEGDDGPYIPSMAVEAIIRKKLAGDNPAFGARSTTNALELDDYRELFENRTISMGFRAEPNGTVYPRILDNAFDQLPGQIKKLHRLEHTQVWKGQGKVTGGQTPLTRFIAATIGFPTHTHETPVTVTLTPHAGTEHWQRDMGGHRFSSVQAVGKGRNTHLLTERFGPITVALALVLKEGRLHLTPRRWSLLGLPLPKFLLPQGDSFEEEIDGRFNFNVTIKAPFVGLIVAYKGWLEPVS